MENLQNQNASSTSTTPTSTNAPASNTNPTSTTALSVMDNKGKQLQVLTSRKRNVDDKKESQIWDHSTKLDGDRSNMWSH
jgi:hypothetical protein